MFARISELECRESTRRTDRRIALARKKDFKGGVSRARRQRATQHGWVGRLLGGGNAVRRAKKVIEAMRPRLPMESSRSNGGICNPSQSCRVAWTLEHALTRLLWRRSLRWKILVCLTISSSSLSLSLSPLLARASSDAKQRGGGRSSAVEGAARGKKQKRKGIMKGQGKDQRKKRGRATLMGLVGLSKSGPRILSYSLFGHIFQSPCPFKTNSSCGPNKLNC